MSGDMEVDEALLDGGLDLDDLGNLGEEEIAGAEDEADKKSAVALVEALRAVVRQRLGALEQSFGPEFEGPAEETKTTPATPATPAMATSPGAATPAAKAGSPVRLVESARAAASLNASTLDGADGPGAAISQFRDVCGNLRQLVVDPYKKALGAMDATRRARTRDQLRDYGEKTTRLKSLSTRSKRLQDFAKVQRDERAFGLDRKIGTQSLCLPSRLFKLAEDLNLDFVNELEDEKKLYIGHGQYLLLEIVYAEDGKVTLGVQLVNDAGEVTQLADESTDILQSLKLADIDEGLRQLYAKFRALIRRSDLEVALKAGSLHELSKDAEAAIGAAQGGGKRVARGVEVRVPSRPVAAGYLSRFDPPYAAPLRDASKVLRGQDDDDREAPPVQRVLGTLAARYDAQAADLRKENVPWQDKTAFVLSFEPPIEFGATAAAGLLGLSSLPLPTAPSSNAPTENPANGTAGDASAAAEGAALALLFSPKGRTPVEDTALQTPPQLDICTTVRMQHSLRANRIRLRVDVGAASTQGRNLASIIQQVSLHPAQHDQIGEILRRVAQQTRFNALLASAVFNEDMEVPHKSTADGVAGIDVPASQKEMETTKKRKAPAHQSLVRHRRILVCAARRERLLKAQKAPQGAASLFGDSVATIGDADGAAAADSADIDQERVVVLRVLPPYRLQILEGEEIVLDITVPNASADPLQTTPQEMSTFLEACPSLPMALAKVFGFLD